MPHELLLGRHEHRNLKQTRIPMSDMTKFCGFGHRKQGEVKIPMPRATIFQELGIRFYRKNGRTSQEIFGKISRFFYFGLMALSVTFSDNYKLREVTPAVPGPYQYDAKVIDVTVKITSDKDGRLTAELLNPDLFGRFEFTNVALYLLPETGGGGILLYLTGGVMLMILSILFLYRRKMRPGS